MHQQQIAGFVKNSLEKKPLKKLAVQLIKVLIKKAESSIYPFILQRLKGFVGGVIRKIDAP